MEPVIANVEKI